MPPAAALQDWLSNPGYPLPIPLPLSDLVPVIEQQLPAWSIIYADTEGALARATETEAAPGAKSVGS